MIHVSYTLPPPPPPPLTAQQGQRAALAAAGRRRDGPGGRRGALHPSSRAEPTGRGLRLAARTAQAAHSGRQQPSQPRPGQIRFVSRNRLLKGGSWQNSTVESSDARGHRTLLFVRGHVLTCSRLASCALAADGGWPPPAKTAASLKPPERRDSDTQAKTPASSAEKVSVLSSNPLGRVRG